jgi:hypothetical protein
MDGKNVNHIGAVGGLFVFSCSLFVLSASEISLINVPISGIYILNSPLTSLISKVAVFPSIDNEEILFSLIAAIILL